MVKLRVPSVSLNRLLKIQVRLFKQPLIDPHIPSVEIVYRIVRIAYNRIVIRLYSSCHDLAVLTPCQMVMTKAHIVIVEGEVFCRALLLIHQGLLSLHRFLKAIHSIFKLLNVKIRKAKVIGSRCLRLR